MSTAPDAPPVDVLVGDSAGMLVSDPDGGSTLSGGGAITTKWSPRREQPTDVGDADDLPAFPDDDPVEAPPASTAGPGAGAGALALQAAALASAPPTHPADAAAGSGSAGSDGDALSMTPTKVQPTTHGAPKRFVGKPVMPGVRQCHALGEDLPMVTHAEEAVSDEPRRCTALNPFWETSPAPGERNGGMGMGVGNNLLREVASDTRFLLPVVEPDPSRGCSVAPTLKCLGDVVHAIDAETEMTVSDADLTMVHIQSWEQKLDWRSFLSEAVATGKAREIFRLFDVEAEPPPYLRPPPSSQARPSHDGRTFTQCRSGL